jgi:hypothetical protein
MRSVFPSLRSAYFKLSSRRTTLLQDNYGRCMYVLEACVNVLSTKLDLLIEDAR